MRRIVFVVLCLVGLDVSAQSVPCAGTDVFSESRKARRIVADYDSLRTIHQRDLGSPATISLGLRDFPLFYKGLEATALVEYRGDEEQGVLRLGVGNVLEIFAAELGDEHRSVKLRHARLGA